MTVLKNKFLADSEEKSFDLNHRTIMKNNITKYDVQFQMGKLQYADLELAKKRAAKIKRNVINDLEKYLVEFEFNFQKSGGKVIWATDAKDAVNAVLDIVKFYDAKRVVKSKSMTTEEIELNKHLEAFGVETVETDLGEYIVQLEKEKPYHIITPIMHKSKEYVADIFHRKFNLPKESNPEEITSFVRKQLRDKFIKADIGITGANFLISDTGSIALTENEGNGVLSMSFPKVHIVIAGIEKIIPSIKDLDLFWSLLSTHGTGQNISCYNSVISGPKTEEECDGPKEMFVILLDNGRYKVLAQEVQKDAMACIHCGACYNVCPVYKNIGGHAYNTVYGGPIGSVISPLMFGMEEFGHLSFASTLCGKCDEVCPVQIPISQLLLFNRFQYVQKGLMDKKISKSVKNFKFVMNKKWIMDKSNAGMKNFVLEYYFKQAWGNRREFPKVAPLSFSQRWKKENRM